MKNSAPHTSAISMVWPKSGCRTSSETTRSSSASAAVLAGISGRRVDSPNSQAIRITNAGLTNSDGWMLTPRITSQRRAPLISAPKNGVAATSTRLIRKMISATRRTCRGDSNEVASSTTMVGARNRTWRLTKWKASRLSLAATGGLAASDRMRPPSMRPSSAASAGRSTVNHQSPNGVRTVREAMPYPVPRPSPDAAWLQGG